MVEGAPAFTRVVVERARDRHRGRSIRTLAVLLAIGTPVLGDEQSDEDSTSLPESIIDAAPTATAEPDNEPDRLQLAELVLPEALKQLLEPLPEPFDRAGDGTALEELEPPGSRHSVRDPIVAVDADPDPSLWGPSKPDSFGNEFGAVPFRLLGSDVAPGSREHLLWSSGQSFSGSAVDTPVIVLHGIKPGPRLCLTAGIHGDELNGIEVVRRLAYRFEPEQLSGTLVAVPIVNVFGFSRGSRYLPDRRDLNRFFPGNPRGSSASRIAHSFFTSVISHCEALVDIHTGSMDRANLPQVRGDLSNPLVVEFTRGFGATAVLHSPGELGMLRHAASARNIPTVTFEIGGPLRLQPEEIDHGVRAIETLLHKMGMIEQRRRWREPQAVYYESRWVRVDDGGMLLTEVALGDRVQAGQILGRVIDPLSNRSAEVVAPEAGRIIGMALNQLVLPGFAAFNLGVAASEEQVVIEANLDVDPDDERYLESERLDQDRQPPQASGRNDRDPPEVERGFDAAGAALEADRDFEAGSAEPEVAGEFESGGDEADPAL